MATFHRPLVTATWGAWLLGTALLSGCGGNSPQYSLGEEATLEQLDLMRSVEEEERRHFNELRAKQRQQASANAAR